MLGETKLDAPIQPNAYVYFDAGDWLTTEANLESRGVKFDRPADVVQRAEGKEHAIRFFRDPDGNALAIMGWRPAV
jgi:extradiol dioxygenase family protein